MKTETKKFRYGVLGCGNASGRLLIPGLMNSDQAQLSAVASRDPEKAKEYAKKFNCGHENSYDDLLKREDIDIIYIGLPIALHTEWVIKALQNGKHVHCEKTLAPSLKETVEILNCAKIYNRRVMEGFMYRFHILTEMVKKMVHSDEIGSLKSFTGNFGFQLSSQDLLRRNSAMKMGSLNETGCYPISASRLFFDQLPKSVTAELQREGGIDLSGNVWFQFGDGRSAFCQFGYDRFYQCSYSLWGAAGYLHVDQAYTLPATFESMIQLTKTTGIETIKAPRDNHFTKLINAFCGAIAAHSGYNLFEEDIYQQALVLEAVRLSHKENSRISIHPKKEGDPSNAYDYQAVFY